MDKFIIVGFYIYIKGVGWTILEHYDRPDGRDCIYIDHYRIEEINENLYWLYYREPDNYPFRLKIRILS